jgi:hypothetical protein
MTITGWPVIQDKTGGNLTHLTYKKAAGNIANGFLLYAPVNGIVTTAGALR